MAVNGIRHDGVTITLAGTDYVLPPLNLKLFKQLAKRVAAMTAAQSVEEGLDAIIDVLHASLSRNYPDMKREQLEEDIDLSSIEALTNAFLEVNGLKMGELKAGSASRTPIGTN